MMFVMGTVFFAVGVALNIMQFVAVQPSILWNQFKNACLQRNERWRYGKAGYTSLELSAKENPTLQEGLLPTSDSKRFGTLRKEDFLNEDEDVFAERVRVTEASEEQRKQMAVRVVSHATNLERSEERFRQECRDRSRMPSSA
eukprot:TRINITY_DN34599_c0_g1_i2.p1 TRINITY_DN34599_c0_g1~~TRINITY_DN34599_c0_g1_i2.p1  ORF type:complete len:150 (-),score=32.67 TRINITY_DN34599_c0_g1_i2:10-438(-)